MNDTHAVVVVDGVVDVGVALVLADAVDITNKQRPYSQ